MADTNERQSVRFEADEEPPKPLTAGLALQYAVLTIAGIVLTPAVVIRGAGLGDGPYLSWAVFAALLISGATTVIQAVRLGRIGSGYILLMGTSGAFIAVCVTALADGGPAMLATLVVISSLFQFLLGWRLAWLRRIITPAVAGTVIMLITVTVTPIIFDMLTQTPADADPVAGPVSAFATLAITLGFVLRGQGHFRLWAPVIGIAGGSAVAWWYGIFDFGAVGDAAWIGIPSLSAWPSWDLSFGPAFWALLPAFIFVTLVGAIETIGDSVAIQRVSWRKPRAVDYRAVQGAVNADGLGNLLSGIAGTVPNTTYSSSTAVAELTGVGARVVGIYIGAFFLAFAFLPKVTALLLAIPGPVAAAYLLALLSMLFVLGMKIAVQDGLDYRKGAIVGISFWVGVGFQNQAIFAERLGDWWGALLGNGMTAGGLTAVVLSMLLDLSRGRRSRMETRMDVKELPVINEFLAMVASRARWSEAGAHRLCAAAEETVLSLMDHHDKGGGPRRLLVIARADREAADLEFIAASGEGNLEDRMALAGEPIEASPERDVSLRLLRHFASTVHHQQYHDADIVTIRVERRSE